jgi:hypothetical protein
LSNPDVEFLFLDIHQVLGSLVCEVMLMAEKLVDSPESHPLGRRASRLNLLHD